MVRIQFPRPLFCSSMQTFFARSLAALMLVVTTASVPRASATDIVWDVTIGRNHLTSGGVALPGSFIFELGVFEAGFIPLPANVSEWAARWRAASRAAYDPQARYFSGAHSFSSNAAPFFTGVQAYLWGISKREWILVKRSNWQWPAGTAVGGPPTTWSADGAVTAVVGSVVSPGTNFYFQSAAVSGALPPPLPWADWQKLYFTAAQLANASVSGPNGDADGDGQKNVMEYAAGTWPVRASSLSPPNTAGLLVASPAGTHVAIRFRSDLRAQLVITGARSSHLLTWDSTPAATVVVDSSPGEIVIRDADPLQFSRQFLRVQLAPL